MKNILQFAIPAIVLGAAMLVQLAFPARTAAQNSKSASAARQESPFACDRTALNPAERKRHFDELGPMLRGMRKSTRELPDGYEFEFADDTKTYTILTEWAAAERVCCPFFDISVNATREGGPTWLRLTGREGTKQFIRSDFPQPWFQQ